MLGRKSPARNRFIDTSQSPRGVRSYPTLESRTPRACPWESSDVCTRCKEIVCDRIDQYDKFGWTVPYLAKIEEKKLRKNGLVSLAEAYQKLGKGERKNRDF